MKAKDIAAATTLESIPNVGPAIAEKLRMLGFRSPTELAGRDPYRMYDDLCEQAGERFDPCLLDVFISAVAFADGKRAKPWWEFTEQRKVELARRAANNL